MCLALYNHGGHHLASCTATKHDGDGLLGGVHDSLHVLDPLSAQALAQADVVPEASLVIVEHILRGNVIRRLGEVVEEGVDLLPAGSPPRPLDGIGLLNGKVLVTS
jgi:hypothetical protein